jgi:KDO2-lipid IV(A) lauroyltransferase
MGKRRFPAGKIPFWYVWGRNAAWWISAKSFFALIALVKFVPADRGIEWIGRAARRLGMAYPRTRVARNNLRLAFPDKPAAEIESILAQMWENLGRTAAEYAWLDEIFDFDYDHPGNGRFEIAGIDNFVKLRETKGPAICFTGHTGNWEVLPVAAAAYGLEITALFRPPNNPFVARRVLAARRTAMGHLVPSRAGAAYALAGIMERGGKVGLLVDQYLLNGVPIRFFGRPTLGNHLIAKLARQFDCPIYPARTVRLPGGKFRIEMQAAISPPRDASGRIDVAALTQQVNDIVESWVREYPGQWLWLHKRWR